LPASTYDISTASPLRQAGRKDVTGVEGIRSPFRRPKDDFTLKDICDNDSHMANNANDNVKGVTTLATDRIPSVCDGLSTFPPTQSRSNLKLEEMLAETSFDVYSESDGDLDDASSDKVCSESEGSLGSNTIDSDVDAASAELVSLLVENDRLKSLYPAAITAIGPYDFRQSMCQVLKSYAKALKTSAKQPQELQSSALVRSLSRRVAYALVAFYDPSVPSTHLDFRYDNLRLQKTRAARRAENSLSSEQKPTSDEEQQHRSEEYLESLSDDSSGAVIGSPFPNLAKVTAFMTDGPAFNQLCKDIQHLSDTTFKYEGPMSVRSENPDVMSNVCPENSKSKAAKLEENGELLKDCGVAQTVSKSRQRFRIAIIRRYLAYKSWLKSQFWPKPSLKATRLCWTCVRCIFVQVNQT
jgi:hypothetical protein